VISAPDGHPGSVRVPVAAVLAAVLALAGCGGGGGRLTVAAYEQKLRAAGEELSAAQGKLATARSKDEFKTEVSELQRALRAAAGDLDDVTPPADAEAANDRLVDAFRGLADAFDRVRDAADEGIDAAVRAAREVGSSPSARAAQQAIAELSRRGYDVGTLGRR
jgi:hypothetical protein